MPTEKRTLWDRYLQWRLSPLAYWLYHALDNPTYWQLRHDDLYLIARDVAREDPVYFSTCRRAWRFRGLPSCAVGWMDMAYLYHKRKRLMRQLALVEVLQVVHDTK